MGQLKSRAIKDKVDMGFYTNEVCVGEDKERYKRLVEEGKELPENVYTSEGYFYSDFPLYPDDYTFQEYLLVKQTKLLNTIKNCAVFFVALASAGLFLALIALLW